MLNMNESFHFSQDINHFDAPAGLAFAQRLRQFSHNPTTPFDQYLAEWKNRREDKDPGKLSEIVNPKSIDHALSILWRTALKLRTLFTENKNLYDFGIKMKDENRDRWAAVHQYNTHASQILLHYDGSETKPSLMEYSPESGKWCSYIFTPMSWEYVKDASLYVSGSRDKLKIPYEKQQQVADKIRDLEATVYASYRNLIDPDDMSSFLNL